MAADAQPKSKLHQVAVLLTLMGPEAAQAIIREFAPDEIERLGQEMARCETITKSEGNQVLVEFVRVLKDGDTVLHGGMDFVEKVLAPAMDPERAERMIRKIQSPRQIIPFELLRDLTPERLVEALQQEHPQTIALVTANLPKDAAAKVVMELGDGLRQEVIRRIAVLDRTTPDLDTVREIEARLLERMRKAEARPELSKSGGVQVCADILNLLDKETSHTLIESLETKNQELAAQVKMKMVRFEDLLKLTDQEVQRVLKEVETQDLALGCCKVDKAVEETVFRNLSQRGAEMLKDDIEVMQNVKPEAIRASRLKVAEIMRRLDDEGAIMLNKRSVIDEIL